MQLKESVTSEVRVRQAKSFRQWLREVALISTLVVFGASCGADARSAAENRAVAIYSAAIRAAVAQPIGNPPTTTRPDDIFVTGAHASIALSVQAGIADALERLATIRFVDNSTEAIDSSTTNKVIHGNGVLVTLGDIPTGLDEVNVVVQRYERADRAATLTITLHRTGSTWEPVHTTGT